MVFLDFWKNEKETLEEAASQLDLLGRSQELAPQRKRVDGAVVFKRFSEAIDDNGGDKDAYRDAVEAETYELFDCTVRELYQGTGGKRNRRDTLPQPAQEAYMVNESLSANQLECQVGSLGGESQEEVNDQITGIVRQQAQQTRKWLPW